MRAAMAASVSGHLAHANEADVGAAESGIGDAGARQIDRGEAGPFGQRRAEGVIDSRRHDDAVV